MNRPGNRDIIPRYLSPKAPFDLHSFDEPKIFPIINESVETSMFQADLQNSLYRKNTQLVPKNGDTLSLNNLVSKVMIILNQMTESPDFYRFQIKEVIQVGSFKNGTMRIGKNSADIVIMMNLIPFKNLILDLPVRVNNLISNVQAIQAIPEAEIMNVVPTEAGFDIFIENARVSVLCAVYPQYLPFVKDFKLKDQLEINLAAVRHSKFLEENSDAFSKILSRVLKFIFQRNKSFSAINPWMVDTLACYAICSNYSNQPLTLDQAFLRVFQLLSVGIFTAGYGILDPCENFKFTINRHLTFEQEETICTAAQEMLLKILNDKVDEILELTD